MGGQGKARVVFRRLFAFLSSLIHLGSLSLTLKSGSFSPFRASPTHTSQWLFGDWGVRAGARESPGRPPGRQLAAPGPLLPPRRHLGLPAAPHRPHSSREVVGVNEEEEDSEQGKGNIDSPKS